MIKFFVKIVVIRVTESNQFLGYFLATVLLNLKT